MPLELMVKLRVPTNEPVDILFESRELLSCRRGEQRPTQMISRYYDTPEGAIVARHWSLRLRTEDEQRSVAALKTNAVDAQNGFLARCEWQVEAPKIEDGVRLLIDEGAPHELISAIGGRPLVEQCRVEFTRRGMVVALPDGLLFAISEDMGVLYAGDRSEPLHEVEVKMLFGRAEELEPVVDRFILDGGFERERLSKYERAVRLLRTRPAARE